jgi:hypothetical protein
MALTEAHSGGSTGGLSLIFNISHQKGGAAAGLLILLGTQQPRGIKRIQP